MGKYRFEFQIEASEPMGTTRFERLEKNFGADPIVQTTFEEVASTGDKADE